jgi:hypothetical protein
MELLHRSSSPKRLPLGNKSRKKLDTADIAYPPTRLMIHLIRARCGRDVQDKDYQEISFLERVNVSQFRAEEEGSDPYRSTFLASYIGITTKRGQFIA